MHRLVFILILPICYSCDPETKPLHIPAEYISVNYDSNTEDTRIINQNFTDFINYLKIADSGQKLNVETAMLLYTKISNLVHPSYDELIKNTLLPDLITASNASFDPNNPASGGLYLNRTLDSGGKEVLQEIEKGLFSSLMLYQISKLRSDNAAVNNVDQMVSLFGASPAFPNTNTPANTSYPDKFVALYAARRDKADGEGMYTSIRDAFILLKAATEGGQEYNDEKVKALSTIHNNIERAIVASVIYYGYTAVDKFSKTSPTISDLAGGIHDLSEAVGFLHGLKYANLPNRIIENKDIDACLELLFAPAGQSASMTQFITDPITSLPNVIALQQKLKEIYQFSDSDMEDFKNNWISVQGR